nr:piggyBac transposable element-derived protein 4-like [Rhipicephalus microplus]
MTRRSLSVEEAVELQFRLPDDPRESDIESELADSENEGVPALAPVEKSDSDDNALDQPSTSTGKRRRSSYVRKKPKKRKRRPRSPEPVQSDNSDSRDVASEGTALWSTALPVLNNRSVSSLEPQYSSKLSSSCTPSESFSLYFNDDVLEMIVLETNRYARQEARRGWHDLTKGELKAYLGTLILMSVNPAHHLYVYWSSDSFFNVKEISSVMTFKRFQAIMNSLHFYDNEKRKSKGEEGFVRLAKIRPLVETMNKKFLQEYKPSGHQAINESMVRFKG